MASRDTACKQWRDTYIAITAVISELQGQRRIDAPPVQIHACAPARQRTDCRTCGSSCRRSTNHARMRALGAASAPTIRGGRAARDPLPLPISRSRLLTTSRQLVVGIIVTQPVVRGHELAGLTARPREHRSPHGAPLRQDLEHVACDPLSGFALSSWAPGLAVFAMSHTVFSIQRCNNISRHVLLRIQKQKFDCVHNDS